MDVKFEKMELKDVFDRGIINVGNLTRMNRVIKKALSGEAIAIGFIGGSITAGTAATAPENTYVYHVYSWWKSKFPNSKVEYINAGVGATNSKFGVARVEEDILSHDPDVVFAEFSVNDSDNEHFQETFEGLIRRILLYKAEPALFLFNNVFYDNGHNAQRVHNQIGKYYDLPIISIKESIYSEIEKGTISNTDISADNLHPNDLGHKLVAGVITNLLDLIYDSVVQSNNITNSYFIPDNSITANRYLKSMRRSSRNSCPKLNGFTKDETKSKQIGDVFRNGWYAVAVGSSICFEVEGAMISIQYRKYAIHPAPIAKVVIDGDEKNAIVLDANFEETWGDCLYLQDIVVAGAPGKHTVEITITKEVDEKVFYLAAVITA
ncbi:MAG: SGNH/GDSL hydrolase family protein [Mobilitalea sp.]